MIITERRHAVDNIFNYEHPFVCTDAVVLTIKTKKADSYRKLPSTNLRVLLYKRTTEPYSSKWSLPGGFLSIDEMPKESICRKISEKSHIEKCWLEQLYTFCDLERDPRARVISISYLGLMAEAESRKYEKNAIWFTILVHPDQTLTFQNDDVLLTASDLGFDHYNIINIALERLRSKILYTNVIFNLLPEEFTLTQLQNVYETILGKKEQAANFRRKIMDQVQETDCYTSDKGHRPAKLFTKK